MAHRLTPEELTAATAHYERYLQTHGVKFTQPRQQILDAVLAMDGHFEAEQLLYELRQRGQRVGKATIYRTLPLLVDCGILKQVRFDVKQAHYEHAFGEDAHDHMVCRRCGRIIEFAADDVVELRAQLAGRYQFHPISHRFQISGLCWTCATACPAALPLAQPAREPETELGIAERVSPDRLRRVNVSEAALHRRRPPPGSA